MAGAEMGLEEVLLEIGNRLLSPPSAVDELLPLLDRVETLLSRVEQSPSQSMSVALLPAMKGLTSKELLGHSDVDVKVAVVSCISEITRITAPEAPYDDDLMKDIFQMIVESFEKLDDVQNRSYSKRVSILETVAKVRSCVVMLDLECDALILEMFHHFLKTIRDSHPGNVFSSMEMIMTVVLEESEDISPDLLSCLLTSVKKDNKDTLQIAQRLAEKVIGNCYLKLKPCLAEAVESLGSSLDDYCKIVALVCHGDFDQLVHGGLNISGECLADDSKLSVGTISDEPSKGSGKLESQVAYSEEDTNVADKSPKPVMGNGTVQTEYSDSSVGQTLLHEKIEHSGHSVLAKHDTISGVEIDKVDTTLDHSTKEGGGHESKSVILTAEITDPSRIDGDKVASESLIRSKGGSGEINSSIQSRGSIAKETEATTSEVHAKVNELQTPLEKSAKDDASTISSPPSEKVPDKVRPRRSQSGSKNSVKKGRINTGVSVSPSSRRKSKVKVRTKNEEMPSTDINSEKQNEGISDSEPKALGHSVKKGPCKNVDNDGNLSMGSHSNMDFDVISDSEGKPLARAGSSPQMEKASEGEISGKRRASKIKQQKGRLSSEGTVTGQPIPKEKVSSVKTDVKGDQDKNHVAETPKKKSRMKHAQEKEISRTTALKYDESLVGAKIKVWWPDDRQFYPGVIDSYNPDSMRHKVLYADGDEENLLLKEEVFDFLKGDEEDEGQDDSTPVAASEISRKKTKTPGSSSKKSKADTYSKRGRGSAGKGSGSRAESDGKHGVDATKLTGGRRGSGSKSGNRMEDDGTPTGSRSKEKAGNRSSFGSPKAGSTPEEEVRKKPTDASPKTPIKSKDGTPKTVSKANDGVAKSGTKSKDDGARNSSKSNKGGKSTAGQIMKGGSTPKSGRSEVNGRGKTGSSKRRRNEEATSNVNSSAGTTKDSEERSGKRRRRGSFVIQPAV